MEPQAKALHAAERTVRPSQQRRGWCGQAASHAHPECRIRTIVLNGPWLCPHPPRPVRFADLQTFACLPGTPGPIAAPAFAGPFSSTARGWLILARPCLRPVPAASEEGRRVPIREEASSPSTRCSVFARLARRGGRDPEGDPHAQGRGPDALIGVRRRSWREKLSRSHRLRPNSNANRSAGV